MVVNQRGYMPNGQNVGGGAPFMQPQKPAGSGENLMTLLRRQIDQISSALPKFLSPDRLVRIIVTALRTTPKLAQCDPNSFLASVMLSAQLGLEVNTPMGQSYLIPYFDNKRNMMICNFQIGYRGVLELAYRSGEYQSLTAMAVYPEDKFEFAFGLEPVLKHIPANNRKADSEPSYYYAIYRLKNGGYNFSVWSRADVMNHAKKYSKSFNEKTKSFASSSSWATAFDSMAKKTVLIDLLKYAPKSVEMQTAFSSDESSIDFRVDDNVLSLTPTYDLPPAEIPEQSLPEAAAPVIRPSIPKKDEVIEGLFSREPQPENDFTF